MRPGRLHVRLGREQQVDLRGPRDAGPGPERPAVQGGRGVGVGQHILDIRIQGPKARRDERAPEDVARTGAVQTVHLKRRRADQTAGAPGQASLVAQRDARDARAELPRHGFERTPGIFVAGQRGGKILGGDDRVDILQQLADARPDLLDVDDGQKTRVAAYRAACVAAAVS